PRLQTNPYLVVILLSRVIKRLGDPEHIKPKVIESPKSSKACSPGFAFLQDFYRRINENGHPRGSDAPGEVVLQLRLRSLMVADDLLLASPWPKTPAGSHLNLLVNRVFTWGRLR